MVRGAAEVIAATMAASGAMSGPHAHRAEQTEQSVAHACVHRAVDDEPQRHRAQREPAHQTVARSRYRDHPFGTLLARLTASVATEEIRVVASPQARKRPAERTLLFDNLAVKLVDLGSTESAPADAINPVGRVYSRALVAATGNPSYKDVIVLARHILRRRENPTNIAQLPSEPPVSLHFNPTRPAEDVHVARGGVCLLIDRRPAIASPRARPGDGYTRADAQH